MCFLKDMVLQKQPHMRLLLQYTLFGQFCFVCKSFTGQQ